MKSLRKSDIRKLGSALPARTLALMILVAGCGKQAANSTSNESGSQPSATAEQPANPAAPATRAQPGFVTTRSGLHYKDTKIGTGAVAKAGDTVSLTYKGWLDNGSVFDASSRHGGEPISFSLGQGQVIKGWDEGHSGE